MEEGETSVNITCNKSKFDIIGISANEFPPEVSNYELDESKCFDVELKPFLKAIRQAGFAAASYEVSNLLSGIVCDFSNGILEIASTDGNRLARVREKINSDITEQTDSAAIAIAEAEYNAAMNKIENKDKMYDLELKNIDTEHNSLETEYESIKSAIDKNIERTFKIYS